MYYSYLRVGEVYEYYRGYIFNDRQTDKSVDLLASKVYQQGTDGKHILYQKKHGESDYSYYIKRIKE